MKKTIKRIAASLLSLLLLVSLCSCGIQQYGIPRPPDAQSSKVQSDQEAEYRNAFYTDQTMSMEGFCGKNGYKTTMNEVRSLLAEDVLHKHDIFRYDVIVDQISESVFIQNHHNNKLNYLHYYNKDGLASSKVIKKKETVEAKNKGKIKPLEMALKHAFETDDYKDGLCVFTTDGYEQNRDYSVMFAPLAENVFKRGNAVAFIGIRSDFKGTVWLATGNPKDNFNWVEPRMFFLLVTGPVEKVVKFSSDLSARLNEKNIENYTSTFLPPDKIMSVIEESVKFEPEDEEAVSLSDVAPGKSFFAMDMTENVIKEEGKEYYPTFSARVAKKGNAMTVFTVATDVLEGIKTPSFKVDTEIMSYNGLIETDEPDEEDSDNAVIAVSGEPDQGRKTQDEKTDTEDNVLRGLNLDVKPASYDVKDSIVVKASFSKKGKLQIRTVFKDTSLLKDEGDILVKYSVRIDKITDTPQWVLDNSSSSLLTKADKAKTLDLKYVYEGLKQSCNATMDNGELFTFYCYYSVN